MTSRLCTVVACCNVGRWAGSEWHVSLTTYRYRETSASLPTGCRCKPGPQARKWTGTLIPTTVCAGKEMGCRVQLAWSVRECIGRCHTFKCVHETKRPRLSFLSLVDQRLQSSARRGSERCCRYANNHRVGLMQRTCSCARLAQHHAVQLGPEPQPKRHC